MAVHSPTPQTETPRRAFSVDELHSMSGVSTRRIRKGIAEGEISVVRVLGRVLIPASEVERLLTPQTEGGRDAH